ncbi:hypothetical protein BGX27_006110 [Mortierella sp. AM989]|nr:hypothetical protein BGX27_006110 [Mortierella sp. AM989]
MEQDPYSNNVDYDVDEVLEMNQAYTTQGMNDDPFTYTEDVDELAGRRGSLQSNVHTSLHLRASSISPSQSVADTVGKLGGGLGSLLESLASTPTQSIMGKAVALDIDFRQEALHARPGHVGEFPTPVRIHSLLDKEEKEVLALKDIVECNVDQAVEVDRDGLPPAQYISLSHPVPHSSDSLTVKGASMPLPEPEPIPASSSGDDIPEGVPFMPLEKITDGPPKDVDVYDVVEQNDENSVPNVPPGLSHEQSASDGSGQTITRREYEMTTKNRESIQLDPSIEEPSLEKYSPEGPSYVKPSFEEPSVEEPLSEKSSLRGQSIEERSTEGHSQYLPDQRPSVEEGHPEMDQFQPSTPASTSSTPSSKKSHHRNIFKRLIRRKSDDSLKDQAVYKSPSMSESQSSVLSPSSGSVSPRALGFFQRHHNNKNNQQQQQQQQQKEEYRKLDPNHPHGHEYEEHSTLQVPEKFMPDAARPRSNSSGNLAKEELTRVRSRPRSSTIHN